MSRITVLGGTGYAGAAIVAEAVARGHEVTSLSRTAPRPAIDGATAVLGDVTDEAVLARVIAGADVVVGALAPRGVLAESLRDVYGTVGRLADAAGARWFVVGGYSSLRPATGAARFSGDLSHAPMEFHHELLTATALVAEDLPATPPSLNWVFVSPAFRFGAHAPGERTGRYRVGGDVAVDPESGGAISAEDFATGLLDLIESDDHHRAHLNLGY